MSSFFIGQILHFHHIPHIDGIYHILLHSCISEQCFFPNIRIHDQQAVFWGSNFTLRETVDRFPSNPLQASHEISRLSPDIGHPKMLCLQSNNLFEHWIQVPLKLKTRVTYPIQQFVWKFRVGKCPILEIVNITFTRIYWRLLNYVHTLVVWKKKGHLRTPEMGSWKSLNYPSGNWR